MGGAVIGGMLSAVTGVIVIIVMQSSMGSLDRTKLSPAVSSLIDILPIVMAASVILGTFAFISGGPAAATYIRYRKWEQFGIRLKLAYEAKFGYSNAAFNEEVDGLVLSMRSHSRGSGLTKEQNEARLKRLARFVEVKFVIPEEERLAETEKTEMLARGYERAHEAFHVKHNRDFREQLEAKILQDPNFIGQFTMGALAALATSDSAVKLEPRVEPKPEFIPDAGYEEEVYKKKPVLEPIIFIEPEKVAVIAVKKHSVQTKCSAYD